MVVLILAFLVSLVPPVGLFIWLRKRCGDTENYSEACVKALKAGLLCAFVVVAGSAVMALLGRLLHIGGDNAVLREMYNDFIVLALVEEVVKFLTGRKIIKQYQHTWKTAVNFMVIAAIGFELLEAVVYAFGASPMIMIVRGVTAMHAGFGFIVGYFYGKSLYTGKKGYTVIGFLISWLMHGTYDFTLSEEVLALGEDVALIPVGLAIFAVVLFILIIVFEIKSRNKEKYNEVIQPLGVSSAELSE